MTSDQKGDDVNNCPKYVLKYSRFCRQREGGDLKILHFVDIINGLPLRTSFYRKIPPGLSFPSPLFARGANGIERGGGFTHFLAAQVAIREYLWSFWPPACPIVWPEEKGLSIKHTSRVGRSSLRTT